MSRRIIVRLDPNLFEGPRMPGAQSGPFVVLSTGRIINLAQIQTTAPPQTAAGRGLVYFIGDAQSQELKPEEFHELADAMRDLAGQAKPEPEQDAGARMPAPGQQRAETKEKRPTLGDLDPILELAKEAQIGVFVRWCEATGAFEGAIESQAPSEERAYRKQTLAMLLDNMRAHLRMLLGRPAEETAPAPPAAAEPPAEPTEEGIEAKAREIFTTERPNAGAWEDLKEYIRRDWRAVARARLAP